ncbi:MAG TPA: class I SAM-dependent methyltransferase [Nitrospirota bacterium]|nr:class I SAM-dependent methyltransferase [Nitrospirota bacterium]
MDNTKRFNDRADNYKRYRPDYPAEIIEVLKEKCHLSKKTVIADVGSGTGFFTKLLLPYAGVVYAVEPNPEMRKVAEEALSHYNNFRSISARAEDTQLDAHSIDMVTAATAFHWFDKQKTKEEFRRILKGDKWVVLLWNARNTLENEFLAAYEALFRKYVPEYEKKIHENKDTSSINEWYGEEKAELTLFRNHKILNWEGLRGRFLSSSYAPQESHPNYQRALEDLQQIYERFAHEDSINFEYTTRLYVGKM